jgi:hypothetical protein
LTRRIKSFGKSSNRGDGPSLAAAYVRIPRDQREWQPHVFRALHAAARAAVRLTSTDAPPSANCLNERRRIPLFDRIKIRPVGNAMGLTERMSEPNTNLLRSLARAVKTSSCQAFQGGRHSRMRNYEILDGVLIRNVVMPRVRIKSPRRTPTVVTGFFPNRQNENNQSSGHP